MPYRSDIDGLRAIAVLSVVLYHVGFSQRVSGGFVGVDVFFVISGYLITGILQKDVDAGRLRVAEFYNRRVRRIFPALFVVHLFCVIAAATLLFPSEARDVSRDVLGSLGFVSNVIFCRSTGYFDETAKTSPLLHTWSLSVEEQFYIVLPLLLLALGRVSSRMRIGILAFVSIVSLAAAEWMVRVEAPRAFYLMHYRAWELLLGSLLALGAFPTVNRRAVAEALGIGGVALILFGVFAIRSTTPFPGLWALSPCVGALAILHSGTSVRTVTARLLGAPPLRMVGMVSYSLYLWHWPLIAFWQHREGAITETERWQILALATVAAVISYRFVELPFRRKPYPHDVRGTLKIAALGMAAIAGLAVGVPAAAARLRPAARAAEEALAYTKYPAARMARAGTCFLSSGYDAPSVFRKDLCMSVRPDRKNFLLLGDSHAAHLWQGLQTLRPDINFLQATASGCSAVRGSKGAPRCTNLFAFVYNEFLPKHHLDAIFLSGRWIMSDLRGLRSTVAYLQPFADRIAVLGPIVEYDEPLPRLLAQSILKTDPGLPARHVIAAKRSADRFLADGLRTSGAEYYSVYDAACPNGTCSLWASAGVPLQYDYGHLTAEGAEVVLGRLGPALFR